MTERSKPLQTDIPSTVSTLEFLVESKNKKENFVQCFQRDDEIIYSNHQSFF